jgi:hypothetical protein
MLGRMGRDEMRAGDGDRKVVADQLKTALDDGRLDLNEYDERLQRTYAARTFGDLDGLLDDLPGTVPPDHSQVEPVAVPQAPAAAPSGPAGPPVLRWLGPYGGVFLVCVLIWVITSASAGHLTYFWPVWMLFPLLFGLFGMWRGQGGPAQGGPGDARDARRAARRERRGR